MKRLIFSLFVAFATAANLSASDTKVNGIWYDFDSLTKTASVTYRGNSYYQYEDEYVGSIVIPGTVTYNGTKYSVTTIGDGAFNFCPSLTSITIPNSVTTIGEYAFDYCSGLTSITIPNSVTTIGRVAFGMCTGLTSITIPNFVTSIGDGLFSGCSYLKSVAIPNSVTTIGKSAFYDCSRLTSITIPNSVITIGDNAFYGCSGLTSVTIPSSVTTIGDYAFRKCSGLTFIISYSINPPYCGTDCFLEVDKLIPIYVPFQSVTAYQQADEWNGFTNIQRNPYDYAIVSCSTENGTISGAGKYIKGDTCTLIATANYGYYFTQWTDGNTDNPRNIQVVSDTTFTAEFAKNIYTISVEAEHGSVIGGGDYEYLSSVQLTAIADEHYHFVQWNDEVTDNPRQITVEEDKTYTAIFSIDQHTISASAEHGSVSGTGTYNYGTNVTLTVIPDFGYEFATWSDGNTDNPRTVLVTGNASYYSTCVLTTNGFCGNNLYWEYKDGSLIINGQGAMYNYSSQEVPWLMYRTDIKKVELSDGITSIGNNAFYGCSALTSITIPNSVTTIGEYAFYGCPLSSLIVPHSVQYINKGAFQECSRLVSLSLGSGLWEIGDFAFSGDYRIEEITSYAEITPTAYTNTFNGITKKNVYLYVPENCIRRYQVDPNWSEFDIRTKSADKKPIDGDNPIVTPSDQDVTITWPITDGTDTYTLTITKNGETVCVLTFNANGQLTNIAFAAPGHNGAHQAPAATLTAQGYQFTVTGLNPSTAYDYSVTATDAGGQTLAEHKGNFSTTGGESSLQNIRNGAKAFKYFHNGNLIIERNGVKYTPAGQKVK